MLSLYFYNIVYSFNNLQRKDLEEKENDLIGQFRPEYKFNAMNQNQENLFNTFKARLTPYLGYYGTVFKYDKKEPNKYDEYNYNVLRLLSYARNFLAYTGNDIYRLDAKLQSVPEIKNILNDLFVEDYNDINKGFNDNAKKNIYAILRILDINENDKFKVNEVFGHYYNFAIFKE